MKPIEYWVCAVTSGEPECWDGPHRTLDAAHASRLKNFSGPKFEVYRVLCEAAPIAKGTVLNRPKVPTVPRPKVPTVPKARAQPRPKVPTVPRAKPPVAPKARTQAPVALKKRAR